MTISESSPLSVLFVCTGNICRSPLAERLLHNQIRDLTSFITVASAGTMPLLEGSIPPEILNYAATQNVIITDHHPRAISAGMIGNADLILTAERTHRSEVVSLVPRAANKTFTLNQFTRLAQAHEELVDQGVITRPNISELAQLVREIADIRSMAPPPNDAGDDDIADPYLRSLAAYNQAGNSIAGATSIIADIFRKYAPR